MGDTNEAEGLFSVCLSLEATEQRSHLVPINTSSTWERLMQLLLLFSDVLAEESVLCLQKALTQLREIWELIGIPEDQRLQRTEVVKKHIKASFALVSLQWVGVRMLVSHLR